MLFKTDRFGMFIHFGIYSQKGWHEQHQLLLRLPKEEYVKFADTFNPYEFDADAIVKFAKDSGAQYICITTKHHDGFCMWDTKYTDYNIMNTPYGKDVIGQMAAACEKHGIKLELYYSVPDWNCKYSVNDGSEGHKLISQSPGDTPNEDLYIEYIKNQITELCTNYGKIHALFWDIPPKRRDTSVNELVRKLQPGILINDRGYDDGDYSTPERGDCIKNAKFDRLCEACESVGFQSWGYRENEDYFTPQALIASMSSMLIRGGNFLLNVGPDGKGNIPEQAKEVFSAVGDWYKRIYESVIDVKFLSIDGCNFTYKGNTVYLHLPPAFDRSGIVLKAFTAAPRSAVLLNGGEELKAQFELNPSDYNHEIPSSESEDIQPHLHIGNIPAARYVSENMIIKMEFDDIEAFLAELN